MGRILKIRKATTGLEIVILAVLIGVISTCAFYFAPGLKVEKSVELAELTLNNETLDNLMPTDKLALPTTTPSVDANKQPLVRIAGYAWNGETPIIAANGGPRTTKGSLMEANGINLEIVRQDWLTELRTMQMKFIEEYDAGTEFPKSDKSAFAIMIMGDGAPFYISTMQSALNEKFGKDKYHVQVIGCMGMSNGEDKLIGPEKWRNDPTTMLGSLISTVPGDGDWVTTLNFCFANNLRVNPNFTTYDAAAVNIYPSQDDDYINSAKELIASQTNGFTVNLKVVVDGELTGETIDKKIDGCATWTPGDKLVFDALSGFTDVASTKDFPNQMATTIIAFKEWSVKHEDIVTGILKSTLTASNQIKLYDDWHQTASDAVAKTFQMEDGKYWYTMFKGLTDTKDGVTYNMGGTRILNYADVMQYYGESSDKINRYRSVYDQVSTYLTSLNPFGFNESVERIVPYDEAVNLYFLKNIKDMVQTTQELKTDYSATKTHVMAQGEWNINFTTGSANIQQNSMGDIKTIYNLLMQAEQTKVQVVGHTDNTGNKSNNIQLSDDRANAVVDELLSMGISVDRFQIIEGKGDQQPLNDNGTSTGRAKNRRVEITLLR